MDRTLYYNQVIVDGIAELDPMDSSLGNFELNYPVGYYMVCGEDLGKPDLISMKMYNQEGYWWLICLVNGILNPFSDLEIGQILTIPNMMDIYDFYRKNKK